MPRTLQNVFWSPVTELSFLGPAVTNSEIYSQGLSSEVIAPKQSRFHKPGIAPQLNLHDRISITVKGLVLQIV